MLLRYAGWFALLVATLLSGLTLARAGTDSPAVNVVLVHGWYDQGSKFDPLIQKLQQQGCVCFAPSLTPNDGSLGIDYLARQLAARIGERFGPKAPFVLIGYSMGGLVARDYVQNLGGASRVRAVLLISPPNYGTLWACFAYTKVRELAWNSRFLRSLNHDDTAWEHIRVRTYWTPIDMMIVPATSSVWPVGDFKPILCMLHPWMVRNPVLMADVAREIDLSR